MKAEPAILALTYPSSAALMATCTDRFARYGLVFVACSSLVDMINRIRAKPDDSLVVILDAQDSEGAEAVSALRSLYSNLGIVAITRSGSEDDMVQLLHRGADMCCSQAAPSELLLAIVLRLLWRLRKVERTLSETTMEPPGRVGAVWQLVDKGWSLSCPDGQCIALTTGERAFLSALLNAPYQQAPHALLIDAVNASYNIEVPRTHSTRLGVMVSRLRRKFSSAGVPLPLKSVHNWGYMFGLNSCDPPG